MTKLKFEEKISLIALFHTCMINNKVTLTRPTTIPTLEYLSYAKVDITILTLKQWTEKCYHF